MPKDIKEGILYISMEYNTVIHKCACGCGNKVNTPLSPEGWKLNYNGESVSLHPSVGNWSFSCRSHYWITNNSIRWASTWNDDQINEARELEWIDREKYYEKKLTDPNNTQTVNKEPQKVSSKKRWSFWKFLFGN